MVTYAECSAIQGQRWEAHEKVHLGHEKTHDNLRPKGDQTIIDVAIGAVAILAGVLGVSVKN